MRKSFVSGTAATRIIAVICSLGLCVTLAACTGSSKGASSTNSTTSSNSALKNMKQLAGVTASGKLGQQPRISFHHPMSVDNNSYAILQKGNGATISDGDRVCAQGIALNAKDGTELMNTWTKNTPDCSLMISTSSTNSAYYALFKGQRINTTIAIGVNDSSSSTSSSTTSSSYIMALTLVSKKKALTRATGDKVTTIPSDLPTVTLASSGKPSLNLNGYKPGGQMVSQTLIKGKGRTLTSSDSVTVNYTGWVSSNGTAKQFDSSWDRKSSFDFTMGSGVIDGWTKGLTGQTVGSQVLLVIPPSEGYGSKEQKDSSGKVTIPANSTLYFVIDILYAAQS